MASPPRRPDSRYLYFRSTAENRRLRDLIIALAARAGLTERQIAAAMGVSKSQVHAILSLFREIHADAEAEFHLER